MGKNTERKLYFCILKIHGIMDVEKICVYCGSSTQVNPDYFDTAHRLGKIFAENNIETIYGGGSSGLMGTLADSVLASGGKITGIIPQFMCEENWQHNEVNNLIVTETMHERKEKMAFMADAAVALPGGCGTMEELLEVITWKQLGIFNKPIIIVNTNNYFDPLITMLEKAVNENFMRDIHKDIWIVAQNATDVLPAIKNAPSWDSNIRKFAAI